ncbi:MAG: LutB/LldF family L-lactate oxidation iron-sulfur protein [Helicobacter sp.]|nr:LutB/LldF family L-lactate oxidation iron-sulfur protein [Helicobacter sp.]
MQEQITTQDFENIIEEKLDDNQLQANLHSAMSTLKAKRKDLLKLRFSDWEGLRTRGQAVKQKSLEKLDLMLEKFEQNATKNGIKVHWASTPAECNEIIYELAKTRNVSEILKGKSMASEEVHLNKFLKEKGVRAVETDLGELIIQLIDETPVHIVVPAIHKNRNEIGEIFSQKLGVPLETEPEKLNQIARTHLRKEFKSFKMGLTGVNFAIADEGAIWLIENEGNGRMSSTACDVHVAICGIEKVVESFEDASILNTLLAPSAVGGMITCYNNIITSPRKEGEKDGPGEVHIILLDNNRSNMLKNPDFIQSLECIRCGTCLNHCPVYEKIGGHAYISTYPGPIGEVISPHLFGIDSVGYVTNLCTLCGRCSEVCPVKIPLAELIRKLRSEKVKQGTGQVLGYTKLKEKKLEKFAMNGYVSAATSPLKWKSILFFARNFGFLGKIFHPLMPVLNKWTKFRTFPPIDATLHARVKNIQGVVYE